MKKEKKQKYAYNEAEYIKIELKNDNFTIIATVEIGYDYPKTLPQYKIKIHPLIKQNSKAISSVPPSLKGLINNSQIEEENVYEILSNSLFKDITMLLHYYITPLYKILREDMKKAIEDKLKYEMNFRMILFIVFLVVVIIVYLIGWIPKQNRLNDEIVRTKKLLEIIPSEILDRIDSLKSQNK